MSKKAIHADVLILGDHPSASLAAAILRQDAGLAVVQAAIPGKAEADRLVRVNPAVFDLHELLMPLRRKIKLASTYGLRFVSEDGSSGSVYQSRSAVVCVGWMSQLREGFATMAEGGRGGGGKIVRPRTLDIERVDESGVLVRLGNQSVAARGVIVSDELPADLKRMLSIPAGWEGEVSHRYAWMALGEGAGLTLPGKPPLVASMDLFKRRVGAWVVTHGDEAQLSVMVPAGLSGEISDEAAMRRWVEVLGLHGILEGSVGGAIRKIRSMEMPLAGALSQEGVADRTLLIGPAGGFFSSSGEDVYPGCWSAKFAADAMKKALMEPHLQDALGVYRSKWRTTLGDYLRGPQQNLQFLLPLVYRNPVMTERLAEAILLGKNVVR